MKKNKILYTINYDKIVNFKERVTRFTVRFEFKSNCKNEDYSGEDFAHLHDTGRLTELLIDEAELLIKKANNENRKTRWDVIAVKVHEEIILINTAFHRYITESIFNNAQISPFGKLLYIKPEIKHNNSKLDFYLETEKDKIYVEVKGCTLVNGKTAQFPGSPSVRALKHLKELIELKKEGFRTAVFILIFRKSEIFAPEHIIDREFSETFYEAIKNGVEIYPMLLEYKEDGKVSFVKNIEVAEKLF